MFGILALTVDQLLRFVTLALVRQIKVQFEPMYFGNDDKYYNSRRWEAKAGAIARCAVWLYNFVVGKNVKTVHTFHEHVLDGYFGETIYRFFLLVERLIAKFQPVRVRFTVCC